MKYIVVAAWSESDDKEVKFYGPFEDQEEAQYWGEGFFFGAEDIVKWSVEPLYTLDVF